MTHGLLCNLPIEHIHNFRDSDDIFTDHFNSSIFLTSQNMPIYTLPNTEIEILPVQ